MSRVPADDVDVPPRRPRRRLAAIAVALVVAVAVAGWVLVRPQDAAGEEAAPAHPGEESADHGEVFALEPMSVNLVDGYARIGIALEAAPGGEDEPEGSAALDVVVELVTGLTRAELIDPAGRAELRQRLKDAVLDRYEGEVVDVLLTELVTQ